MTAVLELIEEVRQCGVTLRAEPPNLVITPAGLVPSTLRARLKQHKPDILRRLELEQSMRRLEAANIRVAIFVTNIDAGLQLTYRELRNDSDAQQAINDGGVIYTPNDMYSYIQLEPHQRHLLRRFKRQFGGLVEWKLSQ